MCARHERLAMSKKTTKKKTELKEAVQLQKKPMISKLPPEVKTWESLTKKHFLQVPKVVFQLCRFQNRKGTVWVDFQVRHLVLLLSLQARKYQGKEIRAYWEEIARDLGVKKATVRKWAYELEKMKLLRINRYSKHDGASRTSPGRRNDRNGFDLQPFINELVEAERKRSAKSKKNESTNDE